MVLVFVVSGEPMPVQAGSLSSFSTRSLKNLIYKAKQHRFLGPMIHSSNDPIRITIYFFGFLVQQHDSKTPTVSKTTRHDTMQHNYKRKEWETIETRKS